MSKLKIEYINIDKLIPYINNPRINENAVDKVAASIKEFGFKNPIIIDSENVIIAGHTRLLASRKLNLEEVREVVKEVMIKTAKDMKLNTDFNVLVNPTGRFVIGSSFADAGLTGRKIIADTYGGIARHGGGAFSGKDPSKVDRSGAYISRRIAKDIVRKSMADKCEVQISYAIGVAEPTSVYVECFGTNKVPLEEIERYVYSYDLTPNGIIKFLNLLEVDYNKVSAYGHFGKKEMPWE